MTGQEALAALDAAIAEREQARLAQASRVSDEALRVARDALARWAQAEKERRK